MSPALNRLRREIYEAVDSRNRSIHSVKYVASVQYASSFFKRRGDLVVLIRLPDRLRVDILSEFGISTLQFSLVNDQMTLYWPREGR
jgi:hypothetical protein